MARCFCPLTTVAGVAAAAAAACVVAAAAYGAAACEKGCWWASWCGCSTWPAVPPCRAAGALVPPRCGEGRRGSAGECVVGTLPCASEASAEACSRHTPRGSVASRRAGSWVVHPVDSPGGNTAARTGGCSP